jgi:hypothetical protein
MRPLLGLDAAHPPAVVTDRRDLEVLKYPRTAGPRALGESLRDVHRIGVAVARDVYTAEYILQIGERVERSDLARGDDVNR